MKCETPAFASGSSRAPAPIQKPSATERTLVRRSVISRSPESSSERTYSCIAGDRSSPGSATVPAVRVALLAALIAGFAATAAQASAPFTPWCGAGDEATVDRQPDAVSAFQIHVVYAVPSDGTDRFADRVSLIDTDTAS